ncbi:MAG: hypothetical protein JJT94_03585 [Bernardetiaceae bacterium]|nr:hypothetical protein [Bernardetiaceae bacterium]
MIFSEFDTANKNQWKEAALKMLKGSAYEANLVWNFAEGQAIDAYFDKSDSDAFSYIDRWAQAEASAKTETFAARVWYNQPLIKVEKEAKANSEALLALNNGAEGIVFDIRACKAIDMQQLLADIALPYCRVSFIAEAQQQKIKESFGEFVKKQSTQNEKLKGAWFMPSQQVPSHLTLLAMEGFAEQVIYETEAITPQNAANIIAKGLQQLADSIEQLKGSSYLEQPKPSFEFVVNMGNSFFVQMACLRALRLLADELGQSLCQKQITLSIHAFTQPDAQQIADKDPYTNLISNTTQALSAVLGLADALTVLPHDLGQIDSKVFSARIARNVSTILKEESHIDKTADPVMGAYYINALTDKIAQAAWQKFVAG